MTSAGDCDGSIARITNGAVELPRRKVEKGSAPSGSIDVEDEASRCEAASRESAAIGAKECKPPERSIARQNCTNGTGELHAATMANAEKERSVGS